MPSGLRKQKTLKLVSEIPENPKGGKKKNGNCDRKGKKVELKTAKN